jgi:peptidyl-prolyl cis-trans isomerase SurA
LPGKLKNKIYNKFIRVYQVMTRKVNFKGAKATVQKSNFRFLTYIFLAVFAFALTACQEGAGTGSAPTGTDPNDTAATVNGKAIKMEEVERALKQQAQGQPINLSPLELAAARLQILEGLIQQEVMFQKAEKEGTVPTDEEVSAELNRLKTQSGKSQEQYEKDLQTSGTTEQELRESLKKQLAINKLVEKVTGKIEPPKDSEIEAFYNSNREAFKNKRGAQLGAIVIDPQKVSEDDTTTTEIEAQQKAKEVGDRLLKGADFATVAREASEDPQTRLQGGDWRYFSEEEMRQVFSPEFADFVMTKMQNGQIIPQAIPFQGKILIIKLQRKQETDEERTLNTPGVREEITKFLIDSRKQLLSQSYAATAMNEAKIENFLAQKVISNPNELSGARPASATTPAANANANTNTAVNANAANGSPSVNTNANAAPANRTNANR